MSLAPTLCTLGVQQKTELPAKFQQNRTSQSWDIATSVFWSPAGPLFAVSGGTSGWEPQEPLLFDLEPALQATSPLEAQNWLCTSGTFDLLLISLERLNKNACSTITYIACHVTNSHTDFQQKRSSGSVAARPFTSHFAYRLLCTAAQSLNSKGYISASADLLTSQSCTHTHHTLSCTKESSLNITKFFGLDLLVCLDSQARFQLFRGFIWSNLVKLLI